MMVCVLSACSDNTVPGSTDSSNKQNNGGQSGKLVKWSNDAMRVSFLYPERSKVSVIPGQHSGRVQIVGGSPVTVDLDIQTIAPSDNATFKAAFSIYENSQSIYHVKI
jgi:hypothetical protein